MRSIFSFFFNQTTFQQKKLIISVTILFGILSPGLIGIAVWFKEPVFMCKIVSDDVAFECNQEIACSNTFEYWIDESKSSQSLAVRIGLICERKYLKRMLISAYFLGGVFGCILNILVYVPAKKRKITVSCLGMIHALANLGIFLFPEDIGVLPIFFALLSFTWIIIHSYCFMIMNENFQGDVAKSVIMIMMLCWGFSGILYSFISYVFNANYQILFFLIGLITIVDSVYLFFHKPQSEPRALSKSSKNLFGIIKEMWPLSQIRFNIITFIISWSAFCVTYNDVFLKLETVGGSLYLNMGLISAFEMSASFISGIISLRVDISGCIKSFMICEVILGILFLFAPIEVKHLSSFESFLLLIFMIATKFFSDIINNLINLYSPKIFTDEFIGIFLILSRLSSRIFLFALPTINFSFENVGVHPFFFLSILWFFCWLLTTKTKEIQEEGIHDVLAEFKVNWATRVSVIHNSEHLSVNDVLNTVMIDERRLSEIRSSRILLRKSKSSSSIDSDHSQQIKNIEIKNSPHEIGISLETHLIEKEGKI